MVVPTLIILDDTYNGSTVKLLKSQSLELRLSGNPTTGYTWIRATSDNSTKSAKSLSCSNFKVSAEFVQSNDGLLGSPGIYNITVTPKKLGTHTLKMVYARPWEDLSAADTTFSITVEVE